MDRMKVVIKDKQSEEGLIRHGELIDFVNVIEPYGSNIYAVIIINGEIQTFTLFRYRIFEDKK